MGKNKIAIIIAVVLVVACVCVLCMGGGVYLASNSSLVEFDTRSTPYVVAELPTPFPTGSMPTDQPAPTSAPVPTGTPVPTDTPALPTATSQPEPTKSPETELLANIEKGLGRNNRDLPTVTDFKINSDGLVFVVWPLNDNLTENMIKRGGMTDIVAILKAVSELDSKLSYNQVDCIGTFSMVDAYGNAEEKDVIRASYTRATVNAINWDNFITDNIYTIADFENNHPVFKP